jgi:2'-5' RNA ligase
MYLIPKVKEVTEGSMPVSISLTGTGIFHKRVLYITVESPGLISLQSRLASLLPDKVLAQYQTGRAYVPHITLVQTKPNQDLPEDLIQDFETRTKRLLPYVFQTATLTSFTWIKPRHYSLERI